MSIKPLCNDFVTVIQPHQKMRGYDMNSKKEYEIHQMLASLEARQGMPFQINLDGSPDMEMDGRQNPVKGEVYIADGKYGTKKKEPKSLAWIYTQDKSYVQWVRAHINQTSAPGMQQLRIYIHYRDQAKKMRMQKENMTQAPVPPKMCSAQGMKHRLDLSDEVINMDWKYEDQMSQHSWELPQHVWEMPNDTIVNHQRAMQNWAAMVQGAKDLRTLRLDNMKEKLQHVRTDQVAKFLTNMVNA